MEYYSAIKKNAFKSVLMSWMKLEPIIQSEVSQQGKHQYSILMHIYGTMNFQMFKLVLEKAEEPKIKLPTSAGPSKKQDRSRKTSTSALLTMPKPFNCVNDNKLWKILQEMGMPDHLTCLLRNLYAGQEATVRTGHGTTD